MTATTVTTVTTVAASTVASAVTDATGTAVPVTAAQRVEVRDGESWVTVCRLSVLTPGRGVAALLPCGTQAAVFVDRAGRPYVIGNRDPFTGAYVLSRGLLGSVDGAPFVASPLLKQRFDLETGHCLDDPAASVPVFPCRTR